MAREGRTKKVSTYYFQGRILIGRNEGNEFRDFSEFFNAVHWVVSFLSGGC